jgi:hypothetical protein
MTTTQKQTAANNAILAYAKATYNMPTFKLAAKVMNEEGREAAIRYLASLVREEYRAAEVEMLQSK